MNRRPGPPRSQLKIDFDVDERVEELAVEFAELLRARVPELGPASRDLGSLTAELASAAWRKLARHEEPREIIRCHDCDHPTRHDERVRVVVCTRCGLAGNSPGSDG